MAKLYIVTQDQENYGDDVIPHWKMKGGEDFFVPNFEAKTDAEIDNAVIKLRPQIEVDDGFWKRHIITWMVVPDDFMTDFEKSQMEYDGRITYPTKIIELV